jgi:hypothetical protein
MPLNGPANLSSRWQAEALGSADFGTNSLKLDEIDAIGLSSGSGLNQASLLFADQRTVTASANDDVDLAGALPDNLGGTLTFTKIKAIRIRADAANPGDLLVGPAPANGFVSPFNAAADRVRVPPGGRLELVNPTANGWTVTAATADLLRITNGSGAGSANYKIEILGA